jgi:DNA damage-binding protein 1
LRIIRNGIGIHESANVELPGIKAMWPLKIFSEDFDDHIVLAFYGYTKLSLASIFLYYFRFNQILYRLFSIVEEEFEDIELNAFDLNTQTLHCSNVLYDQIIQVRTKRKNMLNLNIIKITIYE